jgi:hypothetical protein
VINAMHERWQTDFGGDIRNGHRNTLLVDTHGIGGLEASVLRCGKLVSPLRVNSIDIAAGW